MAKLSNLKNLTALAKAAQGRRGKEVLTVSVDEVVSKPQVRKRFRQIEELAASLVVEGQQSPIIVSPKGVDGKYTIQKGERRWRACKHAGLKTIDIIVNEEPDDVLAETAGELIENIQRDDLAPLEIANALQVFVDAGMKQRAIAERIGKNISFVSTHLSLLRLPECVRELYDNEITADVETLNNLRLLYELNPERCRAVCSVAIHDGITRKQSRDLLNDAKRIQEEATRPEPIEDAAEEGAGVTQPSAIKTGRVDVEADESEIELTDLETAERQQPKVKKLASQDAGDAQLPESAAEWREVHPAEVVIAVRVNVDGALQEGQLMTNRVALNPGTVWVSFPQSGEADIQVCTDATNVEIVSVEG